MLDHRPWKCNDLERTNDKTFKWSFLFSFSNLVDRTHVYIYLYMYCVSIIYLFIICLSIYLLSIYFLFVHLLSIYLSSSLSSIFFSLSSISISPTVPIFWAIMIIHCLLNLEGDLRDLPSITLRQWRFRLCSGEVIKHLVANLMIVQKLLRCLIPGQYGWTSFQVCSGGFNSSCLPVY